MAAKFVIICLWNAKTAEQMSKATTDNKFIVSVYIPRAACRPPGKAGKRLA
jgi:hypothetical protein